MAALAVHTALTVRHAARLVALAATVAAVIVVLVEPPTSVRALVVLPWVFVVPGWAWTRRVRLPDRVDALVLGLAVSAVLVVLIAGTMALIGAWSARWVFALLVAAALAGLALPDAHPRQRIAEEGRS